MRELALKISSLMRATLKILLKILLRNSCMKFDLDPRRQYSRDNSFSRQVHQNALRGNNVEFACASNVCFRILISAIKSRAVVIYLCKSLSMLISLQSKVVVVALEYEPRIATVRIGVWIWVTILNDLDSFSFFVPNSEVDRRHLSHSFLNFYLQMESFYQTIVKLYSMVLWRATCEHE